MAENLQNEQNEQKKNNFLYAGIDLGRDFSQVSFFTVGMDEPATISTVQGAEKYEIPTAICRTKSGKYYYGEEARRRKQDPIVTYYDNLVERALEENGKKEQTYHDLLYLYISRLLLFRKSYETEKDQPVSLSFTVPDLTPEMVELLFYIRDRLEIPPEHFRITDYQESFFDYLIMRDKDIWRHDAVVFDFHEDTITVMILKKDTTRTPGRAWVLETTRMVPKEDRKDVALLDEFFAEVVQEAFAKRIISGVYLIGSGFEGDWLTDSRTRDALGSNKRIFIGKNLYTKGVCLGTYRKNRVQRESIHFISRYQMQTGISARVLKDQQPYDLPLVQTGESWFNSFCSHDLLYNGSRELSIWLQQPDGKRLFLTTLKLEDFPDVRSKAMYLKLRAKPKDEDTLELELTDEGFGSFYTSSGKTWKFEVPMKPEEK